MSGSLQTTAFDTHLSTGATHVSRCWRVTRRDGTAYGFTDHDADLAFEGTTFKAQTGLSALAVSQTTGLSVDNTEAIGALCDEAISEADLIAGRFDGAGVEAWLVQWDAPENRVLQFKGNLGDITRANGGFNAELRGLSEKLNMPVGRVYQHNCPEVLGSTACGVDLSDPGYFVEAAISAVTDGRQFSFDGLVSYEPRWFERGRLEVLDGAANGLSAAIKIDRIEAGSRQVEIWDRLRSPISAGDRVRLTAGCDKRMETCRLKFHNLLNFRGFPDLPSEDWMVAHPTRLSARQGGSRR